MVAYLFLLFKASYILIPVDLIIPLVLQNEYITLDEARHFYIIFQINLHAVNSALCLIYEFFSLYSRIKFYHCDKRNTSFECIHGVPFFLFCFFFVSPLFFSCHTKYWQRTIPLKLHAHRLYCCQPSLCCLPISISLEMRQLICCICAIELLLLSRCAGGELGNHFILSARIWIHVRQRLQGLTIHTHIFAWVL